MIQGKPISSIVVQKTIQTMELEIGQQHLQLALNNSRTSMIQGKAIS